MALYPNDYHTLFPGLSGNLVTGDIAAWPIDPMVSLPSVHERQTDPETANPLAGFCLPLVPVEINFASAPTTPCQPAQPALNIPPVCIRSSAG